MTSPNLSPQRLSRLIAWAKLWLQGFAAVLLALAASNPARVRRELDAIARLLGDLVVLRTAQRLRPSPPASWRAPVRRAGSLRTAKGGRLRARLRARDPIARFFVILAFVRDLEAEVSRMCKRLSRGLTRLRPIAPATAEAPPIACAPFAAAPTVADTS